MFLYLTNIHWATSKSTAVSVHSRNQRAQSKTKQKISNCEKKKKIFLKEKLSLYFLAIIKKKLAVLVAENFWIPMLMFPSIKVVSWKLMIHIYLLASSIRDTGFIFFQLLMWQTPNTEILENVSAKRFISYWNSKLHHVQLKITNIQEIHETCWLYMFKKGILLSIFLYYTVLSLRTKQ